VAKGDNLGEFEQLVMATTLILGENAYGMTIHEEVERMVDSKRDVSLGAVYITLDRLEQKDFVKSWYSGATPGRSGRVKRFFELTETGKTALRTSMTIMAKLVDELRKRGVLHDSTTAE